MEMSVKLKHLGPNLTRVELPHLMVWFSYETPVAVHTLDGSPGLMARNQWSATTGKHLGQIKRDSGLSFTEVDHDVLLAELAA